MWSSLNQFRDGALLFLRLALGSFYIWLHGWSLMAGGVAGWKKAGWAMQHIGINFLPAAWGFMGAFAATVAIVLLILGLCFRPACLLILITLTVVAIARIKSGGVAGSYHSIEMAIVIFSLLFIGPGRYSFDKA